MAFLKPRAVLLQGLRADQPAAADVAEGGLYFVTDEDVTEQQIGAAWVSFGTVSLTAAVSGDLPLANLAQASAASRLLGRGSAAGAGDFQEVTLGAGLSMSGTVLNVADYAASTWTPVLTFGGGSTGITYTTQAGQYVRVGKFVACTGLITLSSKGSSTGNAVITGLPATIGSTIGFTSSSKIGYSAMTAGVQEVGLQAIAASATCYVVKSVAGTNTITTDVDFGNTSSLVVSFFFLVE